MKALYKNPIVIILVVAAITTFVFFEEKLPSVDLSSLEPGNIIAILGYISVVMLVVEQCIEVFIEDPSQKVKLKCKNRIAEIEEQLETINVPISPTVSDEEFETVETESVEVAGLRNEKRELENVLITQGLKRRKHTTVVAFIIGLILSFSGIRLLSGVVFNEPQEEILSGIQLTIIQSIDIIVTAGIIAGGSGRMHRLLKRVKEALGGEF